MKEHTAETTALRAPYPGRLVFYHPNAAGTGSALRVELRLSANAYDRYDCFFLEMAGQIAANNRKQGAPAQFDWENRLTVKLDFNDVCEWLLVLEGRKDRAGGATGNGLYHQTAESSTLIELRRDAERGGYLLGLSRKSRDGTASVDRRRMLLSEAEAVGLRCVFQIGLFFMVFARNLRISL